jgi:predicted PurR-regulated permease PerM
VLVFFTLLHLIESKIIMPKFLGHRLHLHAAIIIIVLLIGGEFFGLMGMFLAAPLAALSRVLIHHYVILPRRRRPTLVTADSGAGDERVLRLGGAASLTTSTRKDMPS